MIRFRHIGIVSENPEKLVVFYKNLGFKKTVFRKEPNELIEKLLKDKLELETIKLFNKYGEAIEIVKIKNKNMMKSAKSYRKMGLNHISFTTPDILKTTRLIVKFGGSLISDDTYDKKLTNNKMVVFCIDPEGNILEIVQD